MLAYIIRRILFSVPIVFGVMLVTFFLFFVVQSPNAMARRVLGPKASPQAVETWLHNRGYDKPLIFNSNPGEPFHDSLFVNQIRRLAQFDLGTSDVTGRPLKDVFASGALPSLLITVPAFVVGFALSLGLSLYLVFMRNSVVDLFATVFCVALMSVPVMVYIIFGQWLVAQVFNYLPAFGFSLQGWSTAKFLMLPVALMVVSGLGAEVRLYRALLLEEMGQDYIRTARAKGVSNSRVLLVHVLKNGMINLITVVVASLPFLIMGSLVIENFFGIPGLGSVLFNAIQAPDFAVVQASVFLGSLLYLGGLVLTDLCYAWVDPRIRLQ
ncbi:MAG: ABC transporter permease [Verrucomicrobiota bacterium]